MEIAVNLYDFVWVKLTQKGIDELEVFNREILEPKTRICPNGKVGEILQFRLQDLMYIFGKRCSFGGYNMFEKCDIFLTDPRI